MITLPQATAVAFANVLIEEIFQRYGFPRRVISDNSVQIISSVMQQIYNVSGIKQSLTSIHQSCLNPVEMKTVI